MSARCAPPGRMRRALRVSSTLALLAVLGVAPRHVTAQATAMHPSPPSPPSPPSLPVVPTTRILAIGRIVRPWTAEERARVMPREVAETVRLYLEGRIAEWYVRKDEPGVVFLLQGTDLAEAHRLLDALPLGVERRMAFDLIPLGPLSPLALLQPRGAEGPTGAPR